MKIARFVLYSTILLALTFLPVAHSARCAAPAPALEGRVSLQGTWQMQSSCEDKSGGDAISVVGYAAKGWHPAEVPGLRHQSKIVCWIQLFSESTIFQPRHARR